MKLVSTLSLALGFFLVLAGGRAQAEIVTLPELEKRALTVSPFADGHEARLRGAETEIRQAAAAYYPQVALRTEATLQPGRRLVGVCAAGDNACVEESARGEDRLQVQVSGARSFGQNAAFAPQALTRAEFTASVPIYDFGRTKAAVQAGRFSHSAIKAEHDAEAESIVRSVRAAYLNWLSAHELARVAEDAAHDAQDRHLRVAALVEQGVRPKVELGPAESDALLTKLEYLRARGDLSSALRTLEDVVAERLPEGAEPDPSLLEPQGQGIAPFSATTDAFERMLDRQRAAALAIELSYKRQNRPQLSVSLLAGARQQDSSFFPLWGGALSFFVPLYDGGISRAAAAGARARADTVTTQIRQHARDQERAHDKAERDSEQAREMLVMAEQLRVLAQKRLEDAQAGYELGASGIEKIAEARALLRRAQTEVLKSQVAQAEARLRVAPVDLDVR